MEDENAVLGRQRNYELLGAPVLLFRNQEAYSSFDIPGKHVSGEELKESFRSKRAQARWYYPMDYHRLQDFVDEASAVPEDDEAPVLRKRGSVHESEQEQVGRDKETERRAAVKKFALSAAEQQIAMLASAEYRDGSSLRLQKRARRFLLRDHDQSKTKRLIRNFQQYDVNLFPSRNRLRTGDRNRSHIEVTTRHLRHSFTVTQYEKLQIYGRERQDRADPAYLAPWQGSYWMDKHDYWKTGNRSKEKVNDTFAKECGNCLVTFQCQCRVCQVSNAPSWWMLHPIGALLETVRLSHLAMPHGNEVWQDIKYRPGFVLRPVLDTKDGIRQMTQCGNSYFVARGNAHFTVFRLVEAEFNNEPPSDRHCLGGLMVLQKIQCIDLRSFRRGALSLRPLNTTAHPRYGGVLSDSKFAVACELENRDASNIIQHCMVGKEVRSTQHAISNLQMISEIEFSTLHPMVLWASARSYVRPLPTTNHTHKHPKFGFGSSLYSIDLRSNKASFQWSPSAEEFKVEGMHSVSGIVTDWDRDTTLFVSSISARKTWELDTRMPCRAVTSWSLPHSCDGSGATPDAFGAFGAGMLLTTRPSGSSRTPANDPIVAVNRTPGAFGIHLYQMPNCRPKFQCQPLESIYTPAINSSPDMSVATSQVFPLPDVSQNVFTCGLSAIRISTKQLVTGADEGSRGAEILKNGPDSICVITSTNKGDVYVHPLLESTSNQSIASDCDNLPLGSASIALPTKELSTDKISRCRLPLILTNEYPLPSSTVVPSLASPQEYDGEAQQQWPARFPDMKNPIAIEPSKLQPIILSTGGKEEIKLESKFVEANNEAFASSMDCFAPSFDNVLRQNIRNSGERTDLTGDTVDLLEHEWKTNAYESDSSIEGGFAC